MPVRFVRTRTTIIPTWEEEGTERKEGGRKERKKKQSNIPLLLNQKNFLPSFAPTAIYVEKKTYLFTHILRPSLDIFGLCVCTVHMKGM